jgi:hypothetical protein
VKNIAGWINGKQDDIFRQIVLSSAPEAPDGGG